MVLEIRDAVSPIDTRWSFFQAPLIVEDALGYKFPVPSEYDYKMLENIVQYRFRHGDGASEVQAGNYELFRTRNNSHVFTERDRLLPGTEITMAIIIRHRTPEEEVCPMAICASTRTELTVGGGRVW